MPFRAVDADVEELETGDPEAAARANALAKALAGAEQAHAGEVVVGVDTVVALDGVIWGKPADADHARATLQALSGRTHDVLSAVAVVRPGAAPQVALERTRVTFHELGDALLGWYLATGEWRERAGGYAVQGHGGVLVSRVDGDYLNVVGLPVGRLAELCGGFAAFLANGT